MSGIAAYLERSRTLVADEIRRIIPRDHPHSGGLYELMLDYPLRHGKALRPALGIAMCRVLGGSEAAILPTAAVLELYHNAFLIHDDVEDASARRRHEETLHARHGVPSAVNVGDGMLALVMQPLLDNTRHIGVGRAFRILELIARMARETAEGQMLELRWIASGHVPGSVGEYTRLVHKKTSWYSFMAPLMAGTITAGLPTAEVGRIGRLGIAVGIAFQIQDDILNLQAPATAYSKDGLGDLWEGKRTLILMHAVSNATPAERAEALRLLRKDGPSPAGTRVAMFRNTLQTSMDEAVADGTLSPAVRDRLLRAASDAPADEARTPADVDWLRDLIARHGSIEFASDVARRYAAEFLRRLSAQGREWPDSVHREFLFDLARYTVERSL